MPSQDTIELRQILTVVRRWAWLIVACVLVGGGIAYAVTSRMPPTYKASTTILVLLTEDPRTSENNALAAGERLALTYSQMLKQRPTLEAVIAQLGLSTTPEQLAQHITVDSIKDTQLIRVTATHSSPEKAAELANAISQAFASFVKSLQEGRYKEDLQSMEAKTKGLEGQITETQARADALSRQQIVDGVERARLERLLPEYRDRYRALQETYSATLLAATKAGTKVQGATPAQASGPSSDGSYTASVFFMLAFQAASGQDLNTNPLADKGLAASYVAMITDRAVLEGAISELKLTEDAKALAGRIKAEPVPDRQFIRLSVTESSPDRATRLAETIARLFENQMKSSQSTIDSERLAGIKTQLDQLDAQIAQSQARLDDLTAVQLGQQRELSQLDLVLTEYRNDYRTAQRDYEQQKLNASRMAATLSISEPASVPRNPIPNARLYVLLAALLGGALGLAIAFIIEHLDEAVKTPEDVSQNLSLTTLASIGRLGKTESQAGTVSADAPAFEAFRVLAANLLLSNVKNPLHSLLVTSPSPAEGKSLVAANLAAAVAMTGRQVVLVDADLRAPRLHQLFRLRPENGLTDAVLQGSLNGNLRPTSISGLSVLPAGQMLDDTARLINSPGFAQLLDNLARQADLVIIDGPPVLAVADTPFLAASVDGVLLILRAGRTASRAARETVELLKRTGTHCIGAVLNGVAVEHQPYKHYHHYRRRNNRWAKRTSAPNGEELTSRATDPVQPPERNGA